MGFLTKRSNKLGLHQLPTGTFTVDPQGKIVSSTVSQAVPEALVRDIGTQVLAIFKGAAAARLHFSELKIQYEAFRITAREMRGGAVIFLTPKTVSSLPRP
jgi:hypothetical protein